MSVQGSVLSGVGVVPLVVPEVVVPEVVPLVVVPEVVVLLVVVPEVGVPRGGGKAEGDGVLRQALRQRPQRSGGQDRFW